MAPGASIVRHKVAPGIRARVRSSLDVYKPWWDRAGEIVVCEVRSVRVVFAAKYISSCVCASTFDNLITRSYYRCNGSFGDMLHTT